MNKLIKKQLNAHYYKWVYAGKLTQEEAMAKQKEAGYAVEGYGFYSFKQDSDYTTWESQTNCD